MGGAVVGIDETVGGGAAGPGVGRQAARRSAAANRRFR